MKEKIEITISDKHYKNNKFVELTDSEKELMNSLKENILFNITDFKCFVHEKSIFTIQINLFDYLPTATVFVCCPNFGQLLVSRLKKKNIHINCAYVKPVGMSTQN